MLTIITIPKAFQGHNGIIQRNALASWCALEPRPQIILCGNDPGVAEAAQEYHVDHIPNIPTTELGTPLLDAAFKRATEIAEHPLLCYVNADIIFLDDLPESLRRIDLKRFLLVGRRIDLDLKQEWDFSSPGNREKLKQKASKEGRFHSPFGIDYFLFPKGDPIANLPPFAVGRPGWDGWFIGNAWRQKVPIIDGSPSITAIHQNHDYGHVPKRRGKVYYGPEADKNMALANTPATAFSILDASLLLEKEGLVPRKGLTYLKERLTRRYYLSPTVYYAGRLTQLLGGRLKRLFVPYPEGYKPPAFREQYAELLKRRRNLMAFWKKF